VVLVGAECAVLCWSRVWWWAAWRAKSDIGGVVVVVVQWKMFLTAVPYKFNVFYFLVYVIYIYEIHIGIFFHCAVNTFT
jgi:hypothetical protein